MPRIQPGSLLKKTVQKLQKGVFHESIGAVFAAREGLWRRAFKELHRSSAFLIIVDSRFV